MAAPPTLHPRSNVARILTDNRPLCLVTLLLACSSVACGSGGSGSTGDQPQDPPANPYGNGSRLHELSGPAVWLDPANEDSVNCAIPADFPINLSGTTITALDTYDETGTGASSGNLYMQDAVAPSPPEYSGITVFRPATSPPDLRLVAGDVVVMFGFFTEFPGPQASPFDFCRSLPEVSGALTFRFEAAPIQPQLIDIDDMRTYQGMRKWLGMLVTVKDVTMLQDPFESNGRYTIRIDAGGTPQGEEIPAISNELFDLKNEGPEQTQGQTVKSVTGIVTFFYSARIAPRSAADIVL